MQQGCQYAEVWYCTSEHKLHNVDLAVPQPWQSGHCHWCSVWWCSPSLILWVWSSAGISFIPSKNLSMKLFHLTYLSLLSSQGNRKQFFFFFFFFFLEPSKGPTIWRTIDVSPSPAFWIVRLMWKVKQCAKLQKLYIILKMSFCGNLPQQTW